MDTVQGQNSINLVAFGGAVLSRKKPPNGSTKKSHAGSRDEPKRLLFPAKLHNLLTNALLDADVSCTIQWDVHGRSFKVTRSKLFEKNVLPKFFKITKTKSFIRQLNLYNFTRITSGRDQGSYYHADFLRGQYEKSAMIRRKKRIAITTKDHDPDFHNMPFVGVQGDQDARDGNQKDQQDKAMIAQVLQVPVNMHTTFSNTGGENQSYSGVKTRVGPSHVQVVQGCANEGWSFPANTRGTLHIQNQSTNHRQCSTPQCSFDMGGGVYVPNMQSNSSQQAGSVHFGNSNQTWNDAQSSSSINHNRSLNPDQMSVQYQLEPNMSNQKLHMSRMFPGDHGIQSPFLGNFRNLQAIYPTQKQAWRVSQNSASFSLDGPSHSIQYQDYTKASANGHNMSQCLSEVSPSSSDSDGESYWDFIGRNSGSGKSDAPVAQPLVQNPALQTNTTLRYDSHPGIGDDRISH